MKIPIYHKKEIINYAIVDKKHFRVLAQFRWRLRKSPSGNLYAILYKDKNRILMHTMILEIPKGRLCDHINGNGLDNRRSNLRLCTHSQNCMNSRKSKRNSSGYKGVRWQADKSLWRSSIQLNKKHIFIGYFKDKLKAARAYDLAAKTYFGAFARPNYSNP